MENKPGLYSAREREIWVRKSSGAATMDQLRRVRESSAAVGRVRVGRASCSPSPAVQRTSPGTYIPPPPSIYHPSSCLSSVSSDAILLI